MVELIRCTPSAVILSQMQAYFAELGAPAQDQDTLTQEFFHDPDIRGFSIVSDEPVGFVFLEKAAHYTMIAEFYVGPAHRRQGIGSAAAHLAFAQRPGWWEVSAMPGGLAFWRDTLRGLPGLAEGPPRLPHQSAHFRFFAGEPA